MFRILFLSLLCLPALAGDVVFKMSDPKGDDHGAGAIGYPSGADFERGDLDLLEFKAEVTKKGTWFEATFKNTIRKPDTRTSKLGNVPLSSIVKYDFFNLNVDVYIDTDGKAGSGLQETLPGRKILLAKETLWEKAVILTPRPHAARSFVADSFKREARDELEAQYGRLQRDQMKKVRAAAEDKADARYHFSSRIQVRGRKIRFFAPNAFLGGPAQANWRYLVVVTGADPEQKMDIKYFQQTRSGLFMMPLNSGRPMETFQLDFDGDPNQPPIVDALLPSKEAQKEALRNYGSDGFATVAAWQANGEYTMAREQTRLAKKDVDKALDAAIARSMERNKSVEDQTHRDLERARAEAEAKAKAEALASLEALEAKLAAKKKADALDQAKAEARIKAEMKAMDAKIAAREKEFEERMAEREQQMARESEARQREIEARLKEMEMKALEAERKAREQEAAQAEAAEKAAEAPKVVKINVKESIKTSDSMGDKKPAVAKKAKSLKPAETPKAERSISERLRELEKLRKEGLVSEDEYQELRKKILSSL